MYHLENRLRLFFTLFRERFEDVVFSVQVREQSELCKTFYHLENDWSRCLTLYKTHNKLRLCLTLYV
jgi:hypothetical protein